MNIFDYFADNSIAFFILIFFLSLIVGSFINVVIYRLPRMLQDDWDKECRQYLRLKIKKNAKKFNLSYPLSHCPNCKKNIFPWHNIPIISYLWLRGQCHHCKQPISIRYPFIEGLTCVVSLYVVWQFGLGWQCVAGLLFSWTLICLTFIDLDHHLLPDQLTLGLLWLGLLFSLMAVFTTPEDAIIGSVVGYLIFAIIQALFGFFTGKVGMGQGDYKLLAALGGFLGWQLIPLIIIIASVSGVIVSITQMIIKHQYKSVPIPFGPYLSMAGWIAMIWGSDIMRVYFENI